LLSSSATEHKHPGGVDLAPSTRSAAEAAMERVFGARRVVNDIYTASAAVPKETPTPIVMGLPVLGYLSKARLRWQNQLKKCCP